MFLPAIFDVCTLMINDCHTMASDGVTVVAVMTLVNHLWFLLSPENSFRDILTVTQEKKELQAPTSP